MTAEWVVGIGSPSGDDQAGWLFVQALGNRLPAETRVVRLDRPGTTLIALLQEADRIILVDAMQGGGRLGSVRHLIDGDWTRHRGGLSSHGLGVQDCLMLARELRCLPKMLDLYGIEIRSALPGAVPSNAIAAAARQLADHIVANWHKTG
ncbi:MAG: hydrogenase maturation protease [Thiobacillaceae bacterium]